MLKRSSLSHCAILVKGKINLSEKEKEYCREHRFLSQKQLEQQQTAIFHIRQAESPGEKLYCLRHTKVACTSCGIRGNNYKSSKSLMEHRHGSNSYTILPDPLLVTSYLPLCACVCAVPSIWVSCYVAAQSGRYKITCIPLSASLFNLQLWRCQCGRGPQVISDLSQSKLVD